MSGGVSPEQSGLASDSVSSDVFAAVRTRSLGASLGWAPLILVALALIGSLVLPARQTWLISRTLRESTHVLTPTRLLVGRLQGGLASELVALQRYELSGDTTMLALYSTEAAGTGQRLDALDRLARGFDPAWQGRADTLAARIKGWHQRNASLLERHERGNRFAAALEAERPQYDSSMVMIADLSSDLADLSDARDDRVAELERMSIASNATLVFVALIAVVGVAMLSVRERRLAATLRRRVDEESELRQAAEALADAFTVDAVTQQIARSAIRAVSAGHGAFIEIIEPGGSGSLNVVVRASAGTGTPPVGGTFPYAGSAAEAVTRSGEPMLVENLSLPGSAAAIAAMPNSAGSAIVVPLGSDTSTMGALFILSAASGRFHSGDVERAGIFGHLAALAYEKVRLLEEASEGRRVLERVIQSRSKLMRGFSHDVKNPIGAADGFADLLSSGVYGPLAPEQQASVDRMRRCIHTALDLIDDLHELARVETGHLAIKTGPVNVAALADALGEEYHAAAQARGLSLSVEVQESAMTVETDGARVRQILANLLSNAIKYTVHGAVTLRVGERDGERDGEPDGELPGNRGRWLAVDVADSGIGVAEDKRGFIFGEFNRVENEQIPGAGLGLAISKLVAESLGGHISVVSEAGIGSTFTLWLPLQSART